MGKIEFDPIGIIHSPIRSKEDIPKEPGWSKDIEGTVEVFPEFKDGLADLGGFSYIQLLWHFHISAGYDLKVIPRYDTVKRGLFSTCSPNRPNGIGSTISRLLSLEDNIIRIRGIDAFEGTPLLDIKPYIPRYEVSDKEVKIGWLTGKIDKNLF
ncbi:tRNA (N6-threonylcarbamoyladenosine(37)-N6)-methyltransferase TrmO [candidate division KSB1 bacterium]